MLKPTIHGIQTNIQAFKDYTDLNLTQYVDDPRFAAAMEISDPKNYGERLSRIPKFVVVSSDDEFMSMDWTNIWYFLTWA